MGVVTSGYPGIRRLAFQRAYAIQPRGSPRLIRVSRWQLFRRRRYSCGTAALGGVPPSDINVDVIASMLRGIIHHLPILKHPEFAEEQEWRAISQWACSTYRISRTLAIPASRLRLVQSPQSRIAIKEVIVGPCAHGDLAKRGLVQLLIMSGYTFEQADAMVRLSKIPYRLL
jgi:hypothetical protein